MRKLITVSCLVFLFQQFTLAADGEYAASKIPRELLKNANAVLRLEEQVFEVFSTKETVLRNHYVITILNEKGDHWGQLSEFYDKDTDIETIEGFLYDADGKQLKKIKKKDTQDMSAVSDGSLIDDGRVKEYTFYYKVYPYTVEFTIETRNKSTLFFPRWVPQGGSSLSVESSSMTVVSPIDYEVRYKAFNYTGEPVITQKKDNKFQTWSVKNMPAMIREPFSPQWMELTTAVILGPSDFQVDDYKGNMVSWQDFGKFVYSLKEGRDQLPANVKQSIHSIADGINNPKEKIARLYEYMQKNTRYISIQLGIGGWQPFPANDVASKGYGDCKALSNYMYSILKEAGINSYYTLVRAGEGAGYINADFPAQQFNHAILCVPLQNDTTWLECTSQTKPAGYLGGFTCDRNALLIDENGGRLVRTPLYKMNDNQRIRNIKASLQEDGTLNIHANSSYTGLEQDDIHEMINALSKDKVKEWLHRQFDFATYNVTNFNYKQLNTSIPGINEALDITVSNFATITGKRLFIMPNVMSRASGKLSSDSTRKFDIQIGFEFKNIDTAEIDLPTGYTLESMPQPVTITSKFGSYSCSAKLMDTKLYYYRKVEWLSGRFAAKDYAELVKFYEGIYKADHNKVVFVKN